MTFEEIGIAVPSVLFLDMGLMFLVSGFCGLTNFEVFLSKIKKAVFVYAHFESLDVHCLTPKKLKVFS